jgi:hypothetical protein
MKLMTALLAFCALSFGSAQLFEVGWQLDLNGGSPYFFASHDIYLFSLDAIDTQFYVSPSVEVTFGRDFWVQVQLLADSEWLTISARVLYHSVWGLAGRVGVLFSL